MLMFRPVSESMKFLQEAGFVFECIGPMPDAMQNMWHKIISEFFPSLITLRHMKWILEAYPAMEMNSKDYKKRNMDTG